MIETLKILSPKRNSRLLSGWEGFFPYYAGYPETFARSILESAKLPVGATVLDPWNGSGTTTYTAANVGLGSIGFDLNPVMIIVARARLLPCSEADSIEPLAIDVVKHARLGRKPLDSSDPITWWFAPQTANIIRAIERSIRRRLVGKMTQTPSEAKLDRISGIAATFYVALFSVCRELASGFQSSNPTWLRRPKEGEAKVRATRQFIAERFVSNLRGMAMALADKAVQIDLLHQEQGRWDIKLSDTTTATIPDASVDLILTSPPYCTRIDYTAATRVELAILAPLLRYSAVELGRQMIGSTRVPNHEIVPSPDWGPTCNAFLTALSKHPSKASAGYYYYTHLDYFDKIARSIAKLAKAVKSRGAAVLVVQDSYYKDIHNDLPTIISEIGAASGFELARTENFYLNRSMSGINPHTRIYKRAPGAVEAVLCFRKR
jgi:DNA modification methylase